MTKLKPRKIDRIIGALGAIDRKFVNREDPRETKIQDLEEQMDKEIFDGKRELGINSQRSFFKRSKKSHKSLR